MPRRLLLVEDDEMHAELIRRAFEDEHSIELQIVARIADARKAIAAHLPNLIVSDLRLPDGEGTELVQAAGDIPVVIMTSQGSEAAAVDAMRQGALDYVVKSEAMFEDMPHIVERTLREWKLLRSRKRLQAQLRERERLAVIGRMAATLAHEIGNPLNSMYMLCQLMQRRMSKTDGIDVRLQETLERIVEENRRLNALLDDFRSLSRKQPLRIRPVDISSIVRRVVGVFEAELEGRSIQARIDVPDGPLVVDADEEKLVQVLMNIVKNAAEAIEGQGTITLSASAEADNVVILAEDTGRGIPDGVNVFEPFTTTKETGSGLGLSVAQQILAAHDGSIDYYARATGGTCFRIQLPRGSATG